MARLKGKRCIITGAGSGIGRASAKLFSEEGADLVIVDASEAVQDTADAIRASGGRVQAIQADAADEEQVRQYVATCVDSYGGVDVVFANAGISGGTQPQSIWEQDPEHWQEILRVNLIGPFLAIKHAGRHMADQGSGSIVCTASVAGLKANAGGLPYSASKAGVISLAQTSANHLYGTGVRVNAICPGLTETGMTKPIFDRAAEAGTGHKIGQLNPLRRSGRPMEIAFMALFLASDESSYVNGQALAVDGGLSSTHPFVRPR